MKKTLIALGMLGVTAGVAHAQSNLTIYGIVDTGFVKEEGSKVNMDEKVNNRLGFRGVEDLGGGLKATFELEKRFNLFDGSQTNATEFDGASNVGMAGKWGAVRLGRVNELSTETFRTLDPFNQYGVGGMFESPLRSARISSTTRYDSPNFSGFSLGASFTLENQGADTPGLGSGDAATDNHGYAVSAKYLNGPIVALANYNRAANTDDSYNWNLGGSYAFGPAKVSLGYERTQLRAAGLAAINADAGPGDELGAPATGDAVAGDYKNILVGASYKLGSGTVNASYNRLKTPEDYKDQKLALGYTYDLSKRSSVYLDVARTKLDDDRVALDDDSINAIQVGLTHKF